MNGLETTVKTNYPDFKISDFNIKGRKLDFVSPPFCGHLYPLIPLAHFLKNIGAKVRFITGPSKIQLLEKLGFEAIPILRNNPHIFEQIANSENRIGSNPFRLLKQLKTSLTLMPAIKQELKLYFQSNGTELVIADSVAAVAGISASEMQLPWITTIATPFAIESSIGTPSYLGGLAEAQTAYHQCRDWIGRKLIRMSKRLMFMCCSSQMKELGVSLYRANGSEAIYSPYSILGFGLNELEFKRDWPECFSMIGPVTETPEDAFLSSLSWPQNQKKVLITLGTHLLWAKKNILEKMKPVFLAFPEIHFCLSLGDPDRFDVEPIEKGVNWTVHGYVPYTRELKNFDYVIHHGGAGITYSCIEACKPALVIPHDYDQFDFAKRIESKGIGVSLTQKANQWKAEDVVKALRQIFSKEWESSLRKMQEVMVKYHPAKSLHDEVVRLLQQDVF